MVVPGNNQSWFISDLNKLSLTLVQIRSMHVSNVLPKRFYSNFLNKLNEHVYDIFFIFVELM